MRIIGITVCLIFFLLAVSTGIAFYPHADFPEGAVRVMTFNIGSSLSPKPPSAEELARVIRKEAPDILMLQEASNFSKIRKLAALTGYTVPSFFSRKGCFDAMILSRYPLELKAAMELPGARKGVNAVCAEIRPHGEKLLACSVHLQSIPLNRTKNGFITTSDSKLARIFLREMFRETVRSREARALVRQVEFLGYKNVVIGGDFNSLPLSRAIRIMGDSFEDSAWPSPAFFSGSHKAPGFHVPVRIDYIFLSDNLRYSGTEILKETPGDHFPVVTDIQMN